MIKHHPNSELLEKFADGELPASIAAGIAIHVEMCPVCKVAVAELTEQRSAIHFESSDLEMPMSELNIASMVEEITLSDEIDIAIADKEKSISVKGEEYILPRALTNMAMSKWSSIGHLARARFSIDEEPLRASLLQIQAGGSVPEHTHKGFELTVLVDGHFEDELGIYGPGDFILLDAEHTHSPVTKDGCLCYTVANDAQHFTQGINKLLNPIGSFIY
ncbi:transcriptional regulator [Thalassotalea sp. M1531]|uniref:Transcriptional regulator n=1 Tax=Thalassotalea algicola TaxID=2716224 RepID=A0A7Y0LCA6_9GAMM|nr:ChrR family anti-sigma-E factor [Thalassotalea algicola]NMP31589.1 transcriptional regulator [Thalassotalea algicola]